MRAIFIWKYAATSGEPARMHIKAPLEMLVCHTLALQQPGFSLHKVCALGVWQSSLSEIIPHNLCWDVSHVLNSSYGEMNAEIKVWGFHGNGVERRKVVGFIVGSIFTYENFVPS